MIRKLIVLGLVFSLNLALFAQTISGNLSMLAGKEVRLEGFDGLKTYPISISTIDTKGNFQLTYSKLNYGVGYLISADEKALFLILSGEDIKIQGEALSYPETIKVVKGQENKWFEQYAKEHPKREQALSAWIYLEKIYLQDSLFAKQKTPASIQRMIYSTNWIERLNRDFKRVLKMRGALPSPESVLFLIGSVAMEKTYGCYAYKLSVFCDVEILKSKNRNE